FWRRQHHLDVSAALDAQDVRQPGHAPLDPNFIRRIDWTSDSRPAKHRKTSRTEPAWPLRADCAPMPLPPMHVLRRTPPAPSRRRLSRSPQSPARFLARVLAVFKHLNAVDEDVPYAGRVHVGLRISRVVDDFLGIEDHDVGEKPLHE